MCTRLRVSAIPACLARWQILISRPPSTSVLVIHVNTPCQARTTVQTAHRLGLMHRSQSIPSSACIKSERSTASRFISYGKAGWWTMSSLFHAGPISSPTVRHHHVQDSSNCFRPHLDFRVVTSTDRHLSKPRTMAEPLASLSAIPIEIEPGSSDALNQRRNRRVYLGPELLRSKKLSAGEWVLVKANDAQEGALGWLVAQVWPRVGLDDDSKILHKPYGVG